MIPKLIIIIYALINSFIFLYSLVQLQLVLKYLKKKKAPEPSAIKGYPLVTIQLPIYNEQYVAKRLINHFSELDYPKEKFEIQVLDDSTDVTVEILRDLIHQKQKEGVDISHITRTDRKGFKAGALKHGLTSAKGCFIAIFDADFLPKKNFLLKALPYFSDSKIGMVQTKWEHLNKDNSLLTQLQSFGLDAHFTVEQVGRNNAGHFINFNGTAGIWRKTCIEDAGGWQSDTLTEDLDLSYRAQLKGWKFQYVESIGAPAELPTAMHALKNQQFRWTKGAAENALKLLKPVLKSELKFSSKVHAFFHLMNSSVFLFILASAILSIPILVFKHNNPYLNNLFTLAGIFLSSFLILMFFYGVAFFAHRKMNILGLIKFFLRFIAFLSVSMGLCVNNSIAVLQAWIGIKTPFIRTPKFNLIGKSTLNKKSNYLIFEFNCIQLLEIVLLLYAIAGLFVGIIFKEFGLFPFHLMLTFGLGYVLTLSLLHGKKYSAI